MKAIVSLFISAYQPGMASIECRAYSLTQSRQSLFFSHSSGCSEAGVYKDKVYDDWPSEELNRSEDDCFEGSDFEDQCFGDPSYEDICWMISRARRRQPLGYCVMYLRYVNHHSGYAKTVAASLRQHIALHPNLKESLSTSLITWLQQHEDLFCQTLHQQLIEFHTSR
ncbi:hypothetical protein CWO27_11580 [Vibrio sp. 10N.286.51.C3]|uniref:hypothetical protein n=1 Tax=unclassified Vibrio TaxID=2614977 RepID=UPI000D3A0A6C|nr:MULTISPECIES: hypothetical protein [unclassified Vibrio]PTP14243.1 hypothetical protein CWO27_11580 [Vibrio sp. 10N.286.51.C3]TKE67232.1 hypothetical protein FCV45_11105 [Vibrio sp. F12]